MVVGHPVLPHLYALRRVSAKEGRCSPMRPGFCYSRPLEVAPCLAKMLANADADHAAIESTQVV